MRLLDLEIENWACHEKLRIDLSKSLQIGGRNGTGKSSILEAIRFIFSESARGYMSKIRRGTNSSRVKLRFTRGEDIYSIEKKLYTKKPSTATMWINRERVADNPSSVYNRLKEILSENIINKLIYVPQGSLTELINKLKITGGRQELDSLLGLDKLEKVYEGAGEELKLKETHLDIILKQIVKYPENAEKEYLEGIEELKKNKKKLETMLNEQKKTLRILSSKIDQLVGNIKRLQDIKKRNEELGRKINEIKLESTKLKTEIDSIKENLDLIQKRKRELNGLVKTENNLMRYIPIKDLLYQLEICKDRLKELEDIKDKQLGLREMEEYLKNRDKVKAQYKENEFLIIKLEKSIAIDNQKLDEEKNYLKELSYLDGKAKCPRCGQRLTKEHIVKEKSNVIEKVKKLDEHLKNSNLELKKVKDGIEPLRKEQEDLDKMEVEGRHLRSEIEKKIRDQKSLLKDIEKLESKLIEEGYSDETLDFVEEMINELGKIQGRINVFNEEIRREDECIKKSKSIEDQLSKLTDEKERIQEEFDKLKYDDLLLEELQKKKEDIQEQKRERSIEIERSEFQIKENQNRIDELNSKKNEFLELKNREQEANKEINLLREVREIFHTNKGIVRYLRERYIYQLSILLTQYFRGINQNPKYREIVFDKNYEIEIRSSEGNFSIDQLSGGEKVQLAIALRIALLELLSPTRLLILDEPFGSLDRDHRDILGEALNKVASDGQLILVTHIPVDSLQLPEIELGGY